MSPPAIQDRHLSHSPNYSLRQPPPEASGLGLRGSELGWECPGAPSRGFETTWQKRPSQKASADALTPSLLTVQRQWVRLRELGPSFSMHGTIPRNLCRRGAYNPPYAAGPGAVRAQWIHWPK